MTDHFTEFNENDAPPGFVAVRSSGCRGCVFNPTDDRICVTPWFLLPVEIKEFIHEQTTCQEME